VEFLVDVECDKLQAWNFWSRFCDGFNPFQYGSLDPGHPGWDILTCELGREPRLSTSSEQQVSVGLSNLHGGLSEVETYSHKTTELVSYLHHYDLNTVVVYPFSAESVRQYHRPKQLGTMGSRAKLYQKLVSPDAEDASLMDKVSKWFQLAGMEGYDVGNHTAS
jgi:hypothetical protein